MTNADINVMSSKLRERSMPSVMSEALLKVNGENMRVLPALPWIRQWHVPPCMPFSPPTHRVSSMPLTEGACVGLQVCREWWVA